MTDLLENSATNVETVPAASSPTFSSAPPAFPPPNPSDNGDRRRLTILGAVAALALVVALGMGLLWMSANSATGDAETARDTAIADADASAIGQANLEAELATARADLNAAQASTDALTAERDDAIAEREASADELAQLDTQVGELTDNNEQMVNEIATLRAELESAQSELDDVADPITPEVSSFDIAANPDFARYIGETLTSRSGASRLNQEQSQCFGTALVSDIGLDALGRGLTLAASATDNNAVVGAMQRSASTCNIDLSLIF